jgi:hypothetical protein
MILTSTIIFNFLSFLLTEGMKFSNRILNPNEFYQTNQETMKIICSKLDQDLIEIR